MKFPGYWVFAQAGRVALERTTFDETELDPSTKWKQAWQNQDNEGQIKGFIELGDALKFVSTYFANSEGRSLTPEELDQLSHFQPVWQSNRCEIESIFAMQNQKSM